jgi:hypothetical protein
LVESIFEKKKNWNFWRGNGKLLGISKGKSKHPSCLADHKKPSLPFQDSSLSPISMPCSRAY